MAGNGILSRIGAALSKADAVPSTTLGSNLASASDLAGYAFTAPDSLPNLNGLARFDEYDRMVRDVSIIAAGVRLFLNLVANAVWTVNPPEDLNDNELPVAQGYADQAYAELFGMTSSWASVVRKIAMYRMQGFSIMEWTAKRNDDGSIGLLDIEHRPQRTIAKWVRDKSGTIEAVVQRVPGMQDVTLPRAKIVYAVDDALTDAPEGLGLYRHLVAHAHRLREFLELQEVGFTTDLRGIPVAKAPLGELRKEVEKEPAGSKARTDAEGYRAMMLRPMRQFIDSHQRNKETGVLIPSDTYVGQSADTTTPSQVPKWTLDLLTGDSTSFEAMAGAITAIKEDLARILGVEHLMLGGGGGGSKGGSSGSFALAKSKTGTLYLTITSTLYDLVEIIDRDILDPLAELNNWPEELRPQAGVNEISDRDIDELVTALAALATAGAPVMSDDPAVGEVYDLLGLTRPPERTDEMDLSLNPDRNNPTDPKNPDDPVTGNPEDRRVTKVLRSRRAMAKRRARRTGR